MKNKRYLLHELSWTDIDSLDVEKTVFVLPVGSTEQHGPQNPLGTDFLIAEHIARKVAEKIEDTYCLPTISIGVASHHRNFSGTLWLNDHTFEQVIKEVLHSLNYHGFQKVIIVNGHGGNTSSIINAIKEYNDFLEMVCLLFEWWKDSELVERVFGVPNAIHADAVETSVVWAATNLVKEDRIEGLTSASEWGRKVGDLDLISRTEQFTTTGIAGSLEGISRDKGVKLLNAAIEKLSKSIVSLLQFKID